MNTSKKTLSLMATAAFFAAPAAHAQVAGIGTTTKVAVLSSAKAVMQGYQAIETQFSANLDSMDRLNGEINELGKALDTNKDGQVSEEESAAAQQQVEALVKSLDTNKDGRLTGTEETALKSRTLPALQILQKRQELEELRDPIYAAQVFVIEAANKQYEAALKSVVTAKKINVVLSPTALQWAPPEIDITQQVVAALDRALPSIAIQVPDKYTTSESVINLHEQVGRVLMTRAAIAARVQQAQQQQQQGAAQPAGPAPTPTSGPAVDPNADNGTGG